MKKSTNSTPSGNVIRQIIREEIDKTRPAWLDEFRDSLIGNFSGLITKFKDEVMTGLDKVMGELEDIREEKTVQSHQLSNHEDRIETLEKLHPEIPSSSI